MTGETSPIEVLAYYQRALSQLLRSGATPAEIRGTLSGDPKLASMRAYVLAMQDAPLQVAVQLAAKWGASGRGD